MGQRSSRLDQGLTVFFHSKDPVPLDEADRVCHGCLTYHQTYRIMQPLPMERGGCFKVRTAHDPDFLYVVVRPRVSRAFSSRVL